MTVNTLNILLSFWGIYNGQSNCLLTSHFRSNAISIFFHSILSRVLYPHHLARQKWERQWFASVCHKRVQCFPDPSETEDKSYF